MAAGEVVVGRRRAARRARRPHRAVPHRSPRRAAAVRRAGGTAHRRLERAAAGRRRPSTYLRDARRVVLRRDPSRAPAAASRRRPSTRCGISSGRAWSPTTRCTRCAPTRAPPTSARGAARPRARRSDRAGWCRRPPKADGRVRRRPSAHDAVAPPNGRRRSRSSCSRATASSRARRSRRSSCRAASPPSTTVLQGDGGRRPHPPRLLRRRPRRRAVRAAGGARPAALAPRPPEEPRARHPRRDRSGQPVRRDARSGPTRAGRPGADPHRSARSSSWWTVSLAALPAPRRARLLLFAPDGRTAAIAADSTRPRRALAELSAPRGMFLSEIDGAPATAHRAAPFTSSRLASPDGDGAPAAAGPRPSGSATPNPSQSRRLITLK